MEIPARIPILTASPSLSLDRLPLSLPLELELPLPLPCRSPALWWWWWCMDEMVGGVVVPVRLPDPVVELELDIGRENEDAEERSMNDGARECRFDDFLDDEGTARSSAGIGSGDAVRFLRDGCPGLGET
ncbi:hypothetical protein ONS95_011264 [Cadophora gregata]|uniref:uncharacterized protein n=1 Tax=Cadophora gregata TaxID=51156 RepID=UPI0026DC49B8|nr:uncharacterized protein ONS95_011264 [Cadophora gregata]KAK0119832.1 hypothetical protein ONS95_011264 [Cadophora gregata]KAK0120867.1 hypothetical protein ONS96_011067 [Cadophora gregata f. sp. sojae]